MRDLYEVLGVDRQANASDLKKAYYRLAKQYHPDHNPNDKEAEDKFKEASNAYQILSDDDQRARYDRFGFDGIRGAAQNGSGFSSVEDIFSAFGDLFGDFFGGRSSGRRQPRGADLRVDLGLSFAEAVWGTTKDVKVTRDVACATCNATGARPGSKPDRCTTCQGKGQVVHAQGFFMVQTTCPACRGAGKVVKDPCEDCRGRGAVAETSTLAVTVPAGVDDGQTLRLAGKGEAVANGSPGHLYVVLHVQGDERFRRDGEDVVTELPVSFVKAALGGEVEVYTLDENCTGTATIDLKAGSQPGDVVVRRGQGIPRVGEQGRGDHHVLLRVEIPKKLTARQEELMRELATELGEGVREKRGLFGRKKS
ncbi:MAG: molecular chaperone DnaJ [Deltaproteobacteria bacterium]|nr:molecular chaperone DnaJ [Deltaproteobacteria bacterium]MCW5804542.1 molecular chaperone DnaJ [Deltaproteobacteria bacterium]